MIRKILRKIYFVLYNNVLFRALLKSLSYKETESDESWKRRAYSENPVLWVNKYYSELYREEERKIISSLARQYGICKEGVVLDIGCGIGEVSKMLLDIGFKEIHAVDFETMIERAKRENNHNGIKYIISSAQDFRPKEGTYDFVLSSGCFAAIQNKENMFKAVDNCLRGTKRGGYILFIDPFHKSNLLAASRVRASAEEIIKFMKDRGAQLMHRSGVLFWPFRILLECGRGQKITEFSFKTGERLLNLLGKCCWSDYKILLFKKL